MTHEALKQFIYVLTSKSRILVFKYNLNGSQKDVNECTIKSVISIPSSFATSDNLTMISLKGSLLLQSNKNEMLLIDTSNKSLFQDPIITYYKPSFASEIDLVDLKSREARLY
jgi:hypothetical protein